MVGKTEEKDRSKINKSIQWIAMFNSYSMELKRKT